MRAQFTLRIRLVLVGIILVSMLIVFRLYTIQIVNGEDYALKSDRQFTNNSGLFDRGSIYFTRKDGTLISAATIVTGYLVAINPRTLRDPEGVYDVLSSVSTTTLMTKETFLSAANKKSRVYIEVSRRLSQEDGEEIANEDLPGVHVVKERWRYYPGGPLASQVIGIVSYGSDDALAGRTGLERVYETTLGRTGDTLYRNFFAQLFSNIGNLVAEPTEVDGGDIITTIEPEVQTRLVENLEQVQATYQSKESGGIIMDPSTGAILAMASYPSFDPNDLSSADPNLLGDPLVERVYEFGSIVKPLTMATGLDVGAITPHSTYTDTGCVTLNTKKICNWDFEARGVTPMPQVIVQSLNLGVAWIAGRVGQEQFRDYFVKLFGDKTGIDQPSEGRSLTSNLNTTQQVNFATAAFGQGIAVTPVQMVRALGAIANDGVMVKPHLVRAVRLDSGVERDIDVETGMRVFSPEATRDTTAMMVEVVDTKLQEGKAKIPTMSVAAKTGTAQLTDDAGGYYADRYFHSFVGFFPAYQPRFIILLYTNDPKGVRYASETLADSFLDLTHFLVEYYALPPDRGVSLSPQQTL